VECRGWDQAPPRFLIHDRDSRYGASFDRRVRRLGVQQVRTPFRSLRANAPVGRPRPLPSCPGRTSEEEGNTQPSRDGLNKANKSDLEPVHCCDHLAGHRLVWGCRCRSGRGVASSTRSTDCRALRGLQVALVENGGKPAGSICRVTEIDDVQEEHIGTEMHGALNSELLGADLIDAGGALATKAPVDSFGLSQTGDLPTRGLAFMERG
jgi:hypothetical protein